MKMDKDHHVLSAASDSIFAAFLGWLLYIANLEAVLRPVEMSVVTVGAVVLLGIRLYIAIVDARTSKNRRDKSEVDLRNARS